MSSPITDPTHTVLAWNEFGNRVANEIDANILTPPTTEEALRDKMRILQAALMEMFENNIWLFMMKGDFFAVQEMNRLSPNYRFSTEWTPADDLLLATLMEGVDKYLTDWTSDIRTEAAEAIAEHAGESSQQIGDAVAQVLSSEKNRGALIARTEIMRAFNKMAEHRYDNAGLKKIWLTARDPDVCKICEALDRRDLEEINVRPPAHPLCRCTIIPMLKE